MLANKADIREQINFEMIRIPIKQRYKSMFSRGTG